VAEPSLDLMSLSFEQAPADLSVLEPGVPLAAPPAAEADALPELAFDLDLNALDDVPQAPVETTPERDVLIVADEPPLPVVDEALPLAALDVPSPEFDLALPEVVEDAPEVITTESVEVQEVELDASLFGIDAEAAASPDVLADVVQSVAAEAPVAEAEPEAQAPEFSDDDQVKVVGGLRISIPLFNIYLNEADELSRKLTTEIAEWAMELHRPVGEVPIALAHSLAGSSATVGFADLSQLARLLEHALMRSQAIGSGTSEEGRLFVDAAEEVRRLLHQFAAGFLKSPAPELLERLAEHEISSARRLELVNAAVDEAPLTPDDDLPLAASEPEVVDLELPVAVPDSVQDTKPGELTAVEVPVEVPAPAVEAINLAAQAAADTAAQAASRSGPESTFGDGYTQPVGLGLAEFKAYTPLVNDTPVLSSGRVDVSDDTDEDIDAVDAVDPELFEFFEEEAGDLLNDLSSSLREWARRPTDNTPAAACMRTLHTLKGGARLAGAMRMGEMAHRLETGIEHLLAQSSTTVAEVEKLQSRSDALSATFEVLKARDAQAYTEATQALDRAVEPAAVPEPLPVAAVVHAPVLADLPPALPVLEPVSVQVLAAVLADDKPVVAEQPVTALADVDWSRFAVNPNDPVFVHHQAANVSNAPVRVRGPLLERMVNQAGEVSITRSRIESEVSNIRGSLRDLTDNLERLRQQLRDIEFQAETQMISRQEAAKAAHETFDPLESDRFTRFQELTRMMAESVNDVATVQRTLQRTLETTEDELAAQARLTRDLQDDLLRTRMVEFESQSDRLYRVVRQAAKEMGKQVRLDIIGGAIEIDRGVLERMTPAFEHLLRNCVTHGIEMPDVRTAAGKDAAGNIVIVVLQEGNEVGVEFRDDGAGLNLPRIRAKGLNQGLLQADVEHSDAELANLIFTPGFSTAETVTELSGRGVGMDVVRSEVNAMGGRIETATAQGQGTSFKLVLPLTTAVTQVVMLRCGNTVVAVPATLIEIVRRAKADELEQSYASGHYVLADRSLLFFWFGALLQQAPLSQETGRTRPIVVVRSAQQRIALHVDEVLGTQEVVVKNLGPQLARLPGLAGMTLLASGAVALIYNPVALATLYGEPARAATQAARLAPTSTEVKTTTEDQQRPPTVLVVDDSLTVRRVTQRLLVREGFRVVLAKDGIEALERLAEERPHVVLSDIEMPRMDGFDLARNIRGDARLRDLPIIMITSRIAQKHRDYAAELGVDHYLGKPYSEEDLLSLIGRYTMAPVEAA
jgi:chemosensory pili system protein ChpA (sensor histidine kinase/response regulator)